MEKHTQCAIRVHALAFTTVISDKNLKVVCKIFYIFFLSCDNNGIFWIFNSLAKFVTRNCSRFLYRLSNFDTKIA